MKKALLILSVIFIFPLLLGTNAQADPGWYSCDVAAIGSGGDYVFIQLTDVGSGKFTNVPFLAYQTKGKELLATAMFAKINSKQALVFLSGTEAYSVVISMFVN